MRVSVCIYSVSAYRSECVVYTSVVRNLSWQNGLRLEMPEIETESRKRMLSFGKEHRAPTPLARRSEE